MLVPIWALHEADEQHGAPQHRVQRYALQEAMQRVSATLCKVRTEPVTAHVLHLVFVGQRRDGALRVLFGELFPEKDKVCEAAADAEFRALEGLEVGLALRVSLYPARVAGCSVNYRPW